MLGLIFFGITMGIMGTCAGIGFGIRAIYKHAKKYEEQHSLQGRVKYLNDSFFDAKRTNEEIHNENLRRQMQNKLLAEKGIEPIPLIEFK
jgi:hypothetical protein